MEFGGRRSVGLFLADESGRLLTGYFGAVVRLVFGIELFC